MPRYHTTLKDVAKKAGVSVSTVSRVNSDHPDVSEETKSKVTEAMAALGYRPSMLAQGLVSGHSKSLGLLISNVTNPFCPQLIEAIEEAANKEGYVVFLCNTHDDPERAKNYIDRLLMQGVDGIIHAAANIDDGPFLQVVERDIPFVLINRRARKLYGVDVVIYDSYGGARKATKHLLEYKHRNISLISGPSYISNEQDRMAGFQAEMEAHQVPVQDKWIFRADISRETGYQIACQALSRTPRPTAFIANDIVIYGILDAAQEMSLKIPQDLSVIGFGQIESANLGSKRITTISSQIASMGKMGCQQLIDAIQNKDHQISEMILEVDLLDRGTTGLAPAEN
ncbi:MAG: LacI family transcriptional regulator [Chloroflexi bacterium]|nr:LacI family transcriptional regulator [Chloroflexota bacterium]